MPLAPTTAKGTVGLALELVSGEVTLLAPTAGAATIAGISAPTGSTGMRLHILISAWLTSGTFTITGTGLPGNTEVVTVPAPTAQQIQSPQLANFEYVSINAYTAITNITTTGGLSVANAIFVVKGIQASKFPIPVTSFKSEHKVPLYSPPEHNGLMARDKKLIATHNETDVPSFDSDWYGDLSMYWVYMAIGAPVWTTLPVAPTPLFTATALAPTQSLTSQPTAPGMKFIITITAFTVAGTLTITGTSYGLTVTETISITAAGTYYSANVYSAIAASAITNVTTAATMAISGVYAWRGVATSESIRSTASTEHFDGSASWIHPFTYATDADVTITTKAEAKLTMKCMAQDKLPIGDRTTNPLQVNRTVSLGTPLSDLPLAGWQTQVYIDSITGTAGTTVFLDPDEEIKIAIKCPVESHYTFNNQQELTRAYPGKPEYEIDATYDILNLLQFEQMRQNLRQYLVVAMLGEFLGASAGANIYKGWTWTLPVQYEAYPQEGDPGKANTFSKPKLRTAYDAALGGSIQLVMITRQPPTYAL